ncbi:hypothetical protein BDV59DRAFT_166888 [Aspergillus ambiguus]|uniref:uncharacterized protein n=1 Tax=Aspergillus ambiguus TaxID=176160 RepID=UPI003CCCAAC5
MDTDKIIRVHSMLHLIFHRNKNQHGGSKWWKWLSMLKRTTLRLAESLQDGSPNSKTAPSADVYRKHLATHVVPGCYLAFSTVVADGQFSTLGVVLLATLARLSKAAGIDKELKALGRANAVGKGQSYETLTPTPTPKTEDVGEVLERDLDAPTATGSAEMQASRKKSSTVLPESRSKEKKMKPSVEEKKSKKKSKRKKDAIDDLFAGLL